MGVRPALMALVALGAVAAALASPSGSRATQAGAVGAIHLYQQTLSPLTPLVGASCRFSPTCSRYTEASIRKYGVWKGGWRGLRRISRCGPWTPPGTLDPP